MQDDDQDNKKRDATLNAHLNADSGYTSHETHRISADQWARICKIMNEPLGETA